MRYNSPTTQLKRFSDLSATPSEEDGNSPPELGLVPAFALGLSVAICHGVGRFCYALLMPAMKADLGWTYEQASWMNTANALGYVAGTITGFFLLRTHSSPVLFRAGILLTCASVLLTAWPAGFSWFIGMRLLSGIGAAWAFSTGGALVGALYAKSPQRAGAATGLFFGSAGLGVILTGSVVPGLLTLQGDSAWPLAWLLLGLICCAAAPLPIREASQARLPSLARGALITPPMIAPLRVSMVGYFAFALAHTGYIFFIFAWSKAVSLPWQHGAGMWMALGVAILISFTLWRTPLNRWPGPKILAASCFGTAAGAAFPLVHLSVASVYLSAFSVGCSLFIVPAAMAVLGRQSLPRQSWSAGLMVFAAVFAVGQAIGSWGFGRLADHSLSTVLGVSSIGLAIAAGIAALDRRQHQ